MNTEVISVLNNKGGVLKTTTLVNIAVILAKKGFNVLIVDADGQANTTASFDIFNDGFKDKFELDENGKPMYHVDFIKFTTIDILRIDSQKMSMEKISSTIENSIFRGVFNNNDHEIEHLNKQIKTLNGKINFFKKHKHMKEEAKNAKIKPFRTKIDNIKKQIKVLESEREFSGSIDLIGANIDLKNFERELFLEMSRSKKFIANSKLQSVLEFLKLKYDYILIDSPPSLGLIAENIMASATKLITPMQMEKYSIQGVSNIINTFHFLKEDYPKLEIAAILPTMINTRLKMHKESYQSLKDYLDQNEKKFAPKLVPLEDGINQSGKSASELMKNNILMDVEWYKDESKKHQNARAYLNLVEKYIL